jgi:hypothetical protein
MFFRYRTTPMRHKYPCREALAATAEDLPFR